MVVKWFRKTSCTTEEFSEVPLTPQWSFHRALTQISFSEPTRKSTIPRHSSKNEPKLPKSSSPAMWKLQKPLLENKTLIFKLTNSWLSWLTKLQSTKSLVKQLLIFPSSKHHGPCDNSEALRKKRWLRITNYSCLRMRLNHCSPCSAARHSSVQEWKYLRKKNLQRWSGSKPNLII